jgi:hypothetical protein
MIKVVIVEDDHEILQSLLQLLAADPDIVVTKNIFIRRSFHFLFP